MTIEDGQLPSWWNWQPAARERCTHVMRSYGVPPTRCSRDAHHGGEHGSNNWPFGMDLIDQLKEYGAGDAEIRYAAMLQLSDMLNKDGNMREWLDLS